MPVTNSNNSNSNNDNVDLMKAPEDTTDCGHQNDEESPNNTNKDCHSCHDPALLLVKKQSSAGGIPKDTETDDDGSPVPSPSSPSSSKEDIVAVAMVLPNTGPDVATTTTTTTTTSVNYKDEKQAATNPLPEETNDDDDRMRMIAAAVEDGWNAIQDKANNHNHTNTSKEEEPTSVVANANANDIQDGGSFAHPPALRLQGNITSSRAQHPGAFHVDGMGAAHLDHPPDTTMPFHASRTTTTTDMDIFVMEQHQQQQQDGIPNINLVQAELVTNAHDNDNDDEDDSRPLAVAVRMNTNSHKRPVVMAVVGLLVAVVSIVMVVIVVAAPKQTIVGTYDDNQNKNNHNLQLGTTTIYGAAPHDHFGAILALNAGGDGSIVAIASAARTNPTTKAEPGLVRVFYHHPTTTQPSPSASSSWTQLGTAIGNELWAATGDDWLAIRGMALSANGHRLALLVVGGGATRSSSTVTTSANDTRTAPVAVTGSVRVLELQPTHPVPTWVPVGPALENGRNTTNDDWLGRDIAMSANGNIVAVSSDHGHVRVYQWHNTTTATTTNDWLPLGNTIQDEDRRLGSSLALSDDGTVLAVGADTGSTTLVYEYSSHTNTWNQRGQDIPLGDPPPMDGGRMGRNNHHKVALSRDGNRIACAAHWAKDHHGRPASGLVRIYHYDHESQVWNQVGQSLVGTAAHDRMGTAVGLSSDGTRVAVGASQPQDENDNHNTTSFLLRASSSSSSRNTGGAGYVQVFDYDEPSNAWILWKTLYGAKRNDQFGADLQLSASGGILAVGAAKSDANGEDSGLVQVFDLDAL